METNASHKSVLPIILCGGAGSRLWPLSRKSAPKQFHDLASNKTMFCNTLERVSNSSASDIYSPARIIGAAEFKGVIAEQYKASSASVEKVILEPCMRDTCAAVAAAISDIAADRPDQIVLVLPSDHHVADVEGFTSIIKRAAKAVSDDGGIMTIGIKPSHPETQFGYIERSKGDGPIYNVERFREKPDLAAAKAYLDLGTFFWNAGIFMFKVGDMAAEFGRQQTKIWQSATLAMKNGSQEDKFHYLDKVHFTSCEKISIDYGIMEHAEKI
ncbi:MAG: mannose-1-phosphate guanylyltransferase, partial [Rhizobiaceae bacterium]|nr:mannose-1-phosphate guanylyltransferase [Rhizobiaceae bacterium]